MSLKSVSMRLSESEMRDCAYLWSMHARSTKDLDEIMEEVKERVTAAMEAVPPGAQYEIVERHPRAVTCCCHVKIWMSLILLLEAGRLLIGIIGCTAVFFILAVDLDVYEAFRVILLFLPVILFLFIEGLTLHQALRVEEQCLLLPTAVISFLEVIWAFLMCLSYSIDLSATFLWAQDDMQLFAVNCARIFCICMGPYAVIRFLVSLQCWRYMHFKQKNGLPPSNYFGNVKRSTLEAAVNANELLKKQVIAEMYAFEKWMEGDFCSEFDGDEESDGTSIKEKVNPECLAIEDRQSVTIEEGKEVQEKSVTMEPSQPIVLPIYTVVNPIEIPDDVLF